MKKAKEDHKLVGHHAPYGYRYILRTKDKDGYFEIYEPEAEVVKLIFKWVADDGFSIRRVIKELYLRHIPPIKHRRDCWAKSSVERLLNRQDYIGISYYNKSMAVVPKNPLKIEKYKRIKKSSRIVRPKEEWIPSTSKATGQQNL